MDDLKATGADSDAEIERRKHVRTADADLRIEGFPSDALTEKICKDYISGKIKAQDLVAVYKLRSRVAKSRKG